MIDNFSCRQRRNFFMPCCRQVLALVFPRWWWERFSYILRAICIPRCRKLFTNILVHKPIKIIENVSNHPSIPPPAIQPKILEKLLLTFTTKVPFYDPSGKIYIKIDGISMGLLLDPTISEFYSSHIKSKISKTINKPKIYVVPSISFQTGSTAMTQRPGDRVPSGSMLALPDPRRPNWANPPTNFWWSLFFWQQWHDLHALGSHWTDSSQGILCWGFKRVPEEIPSEEASTLQIGSEAFPPGQCTSPQLQPCHRIFEEASTLQIGSEAFPPGQCTSPQLQPCHRIFDQDGNQDSSLPSL